MKKILFILVLFVCSGLSAQQYFFNGTVHVPKTTAEINAISSPVEGRQEANSDTGTIYYYNGSDWVDTGKPLVDASGFSGNLNSNITDLQLLAEAVDSLTISGSIADGSITEAKLSTSVNASLDLADSALQSGDNVSELVNDAGYITEGGNLIPVTQAEYDLLTPTEIEENDYAIVDEDDGSGGASQLSDLSDVGSSTPTNRNVLVADGVDWESRPLVEADISDLKQYLPLTGGTMTGNVTAPSFIKSGATSDDVLLGNGTTTSLNGIKTSPGLNDNGTTEIILEGSTSGAYTVGSQSWRWFRSHNLVFFYMNFNNIDGSTPVGRLRVDISGSTFPPPDANGTTVFNVHIDDWPTAEIYSAYAIEETANYITILVNTGAATSSGSYVEDMDFTGTTDIFISGVYRTTN